MNFFKNLLIVFLAFESVCIAIDSDVEYNQTNYDYSAENIEKHLGFLGEFLNAFYAPLDWKQQYFSWSLSEEIFNARESIYATQNGDIRSFQNSYRNILESLQDFHVSFYIASWGYSSLPFRVKSIDQRYYVVDIPAGGALAGKIDVGDELVSFNGRTPYEEFLSLNFLRYKDNPNPTTKALGDEVLTFRLFESGFTPQKGNIDLVFKTPSGKVKYYNIPWFTSDESISYDLHEKSFPAVPKFSKRNPMMTSPIAGKLSKNILKSKNAWAIGTWESYVPGIGQVIWESDNEVDAKIYLTPDGHQVGVLRVPTYDLDAMMFEMNAKKSDLFDDLFGDLFFSMKDILGMYEDNIEYLQDNTDALIVDQVCNPGGSVGFMYWLLAHFTDQPLNLLDHHQVVHPEEIYDSYYIQSYANHPYELIEEVNQWVAPYELSISDVEGILNGAGKMINAWNQKKRLTDPYPLLGIEKIYPSDDARYTKPLFILCDELDFSCADFLPAVLKDNGRATILGTSTAGAGGCVAFTQYPNRFGFLGFSYTYTIAKRNNTQTLENLGVKPDYEIKITARDLQSGFDDYKNKLVDFIDRKLAE